MANGLILYGMDLSPMVRSVKLILKLLDVPYEYKVVDLFAGEQHSAEFVKRNPLKTVPVLEVNGEYIADSGAICTYLIDKYGKYDSLYPKDLIKRAQVNQGLYFMQSQLFGSGKQIGIPILGRKTTVVKKEILQTVHIAYAMMEALLERNEFLCGKHITIADIMSVPLLMIGREFVKVNKDNFPHINSWLEQMFKEVPLLDAFHTAACQLYISTLRSMITEVENYK